MMQGFDRIRSSEPELAAQVQPIFVTIDPARDTPASGRRIHRAPFPTTCSA